MKVIKDDTIFLIEDCGNKMPEAVMKLETHYAYYPENEWRHIYLDKSDKLDAAFEREDLELFRKEVSNERNRI